MRIVPRPLATLLLPVALLGGCASRSGDIKPLAADPAQFANLGCEALYDETDRVNQRAAQLAFAVDERVGNNIIALSVGVSTLFWPALLAMRPTGPDAAELAALKGRDDALREAARRRGCPPAPELLAPARAASLPIKVGERLVYEERSAAGGPVRVLNLQVVALRRNEIEFTADVAGQNTPMRWQQDVWGNQPQLVEKSGWLHWRRLLRPDLALGEALGGDVIGGEGGEVGRLRGQVIALGVQNALGRPFDAAVIELFGDVPAGNHSTRLDGVMVIDRKSGVLLRLDLNSANPDFALRRSLTRIETVAP